MRGQANLQGLVRMTEVKKAESRQGVLLIIDDDQGIREVLSYTATRTLNFNVLQAENGLSGLDIIDREHIDVIICDLSMPVLNGIQFFEKLRAKAVKTPVIFLSGHGTDDVRKRAMKLGAFDFLEKPISVDQLTTLLDEARRVSFQIQALEKAAQDG